MARPKSGTSSAYQMIVLRPGVAGAQADESAATRAAAGSRKRPVPVPLVGDRAAGREARRFPAGIAAERNARGAHHLVRRDVEGDQVAGEFTRSLGAGEAGMIDPARGVRKRARRGMAAGKSNCRPRCPTTPGMQSRARDSQVIVMTRLSPGASGARSVRMALVLSGANGQDSWTGQRRRSSTSCTCVKPNSADGPSIKAGATVRGVGRMPSGIRGGRR